MNGQYFDGISERVWQFTIGGYQVCEKWLKDRRGRTLTLDELERFVNLATAIEATLGIATQVDEAVGAWPME